MSKSWDEKRLYLKSLLAEEDPNLLSELKNALLREAAPTDLLFLNKIAKTAFQRGLFSNHKFKVVKIAVVGGYTFHPLVDFLDTFLTAFDVKAEFHLGSYDNYFAEIFSENSSVVAFKPHFVLFLPSERRHFYNEDAIAPLVEQRKIIDRQVEEVLSLSQALHEKTQAEILIANFKLPNEGHPGAIKHSGLLSDWNFRKIFNFELGVRCRAFEHIIDVEFLSCQIGVVSSEDHRAWYETKQLGSSSLLAAIAKETATVISLHRIPSKKVIVLDLDNTLWGGTIGDDGINGIELGDTSARSEAFKDFQKFIKRLKNRGFLLAVCSKNEESVAKNPFLNHPDMVLRLDDIVNFKANWSSKADNINQIASELNVGVDSLVFVDDNPAEIAIVNQFLPTVSTVQLTTDPSDFIGLLKHSGFFRQGRLTKEDLQKTEAYNIESQRKSLKASVTDMGKYLAGLEMKALIASFQDVDVPRISQLISKSNQFNLTTKRYSESDVVRISKESDKSNFTVRLQDKFGDYGLIAVVICQAIESRLFIDTLLMSCRVLERGVEQEIFNKIQRLATELGAGEVVGHFIPTSKNMMVKDLYERYGFKLVEESDTKKTYSLNSKDFHQNETNIQIIEV